MKADKYVTVEAYARLVNFTARGIYKRIRAEKMTSVMRKRDLQNGKKEEIEMIDTDMWPPSEFQLEPRGRKKYLLTRLKENNLPA